MAKYEKLLLGIVLAAAAVFCWYMTENCLWPLIVICLGLALYWMAQR